MVNASSSQCHIFSGTNLDTCKIIFELDWLLALLYRSKILYFTVLIYEILFRPLLRFILNFHHASELTKDLFS